MADSVEIQALESLLQPVIKTKLPIILYIDQELTTEQERFLEYFENAEEAVFKEVRSPERLLDEATLFLHQVETQLPEEQQALLHKVRDRESILSGRKVLAVDDDVRNIFALGAILEEKDIEMMAANTGKEAIETLKNNTDIDLVLMDIMMPEMDGYEAIQAIRKIPGQQKLPIIALTAKAMKGDKSKCIEAGANDYLAKPINAERLLSLLRVWLYR